MLPEMHTLTDVLVVTVEMGAFFWALVYMGYVSSRK